MIASGSTYYEVRYRNCKVSPKILTGYVTHEEMVKMQFAYCILKVRQITEYEYKQHVNQQ